MVRESEVRQRHDTISVLYVGVDTVQSVTAPTGTAHMLHKVEEN